MSFHALGLRAELLSAIEKEGYRTPTPIQQKAIPAVLRGKDVLAGAQTGTGKTAAFALPILQNIAARRSTEKRPRVLILTPTRELANQIHDNILSFGRGLRVRSAVIFGGVGFTPQVERLSAGVDILTACPGRLLDHAGQKTVDLSGIEILVLDEADRMLDMGFIHDIKRVLALLPKKRQNLLFSATYSPEIEKLARSFLYEPEMVEVSKRNTATPLVSHAVHPVPQRSKGALLAHLIQKEKWRQVLVFTRTKHGANRLAQHLCQGGIFAAAIHGNKSQSARTAALRDFKDGRISVLVATDIASRGLDIDQLPVVVNFELPNVPEDYIHRIGRTGRAGASGLALSLVDVEERKLLIGIERLLRKKIPETTVEGFDVTPMNTPAAGESGHTNRTGTAPKASVAAEPSPPKRTRRRRRWGAASRDTKMPRA